MKQEQTVESGECRGLVIASNCIPKTIYENRSTVND